MCHIDIPPAHDSCTRDTALRPTTTDDDQPSTCTICLEPLHISSTCTTKTEPVPETAVTIKKCGHVFGRKCLEQWMRDANTCPMCRVEFFPMAEATAMGENVQMDSGDGIQHYALGVYADSSMFEHFRDLLVRDESDEEFGVAAVARGGLERSRRGGDGEVRELNRENRRRVYYA